MLLPHTCTCLSTSKLALLTNGFSAALALLLCHASSGTPSHKPCMGKGKAVDGRWGEMNREGNSLHRDCLLLPAHILQRTCRIFGNLKYYLQAKQ